MFVSLPSDDCRVKKKLPRATTGSLLAMRVRWTAQCPESRTTSRGGHHACEQTAAFASGEPVGPPPSQSAGRCQARVNAARDPRLDLSLLPTKTEWTGVAPRCGQILIQHGEQIVHRQVDRVGRPSRAGR